jgi:hypothetical protein
LLRSSDRRATGRRPRGEAATRPTPPEGSASGFGNVDPIPFRPRGEAPASPERGGRPPPLGAELPWGLGSTDPCTTAVHMEPFSATRPSRISLEYLLLPPRSAPAAAPGGLAACPSKLAAAALLLVGAYLPGGKEEDSLPRRPGVGGTLSAIHFQGWSIRQVSCYTLLGGFRLPWPPSCCLYRPTPFLGSDERRPQCGAVTRRSVHPAAPVLLTKSGPLGARAFAASSPAPIGRVGPRTNLKFENRSRPFRPRVL